MSKRTADDAAESGGKRQRLEQRESPRDIPEIRSAQQLEQLLAFQQDATPQLREGIRAFKAFLESIVYAQDKSSTTKLQVILRNFLDTQRPSSTEEPCLPGLMQTWSFAAQTNNDSLISAVSSVLALLFKTISGLIDLRDHGLILGRSLLQHAQLKLIARGLSAPRPKEYIISPCLRLMTELVAFDGGVLAKQVYSVRSYTLDPKILSRNLSFSKPMSEDAEEMRRRPAVRTTAIRYLLVHLAFQSSSIKAELLKYSNVFRALFEHVRQDPVDVLAELFTTFKNNVLKDEDLQRQSKSFVLHDGNLSNIASLYHHTQSPHDKQASKQPDQLAHDFLKYICTEPSAGLLRASSWYPPGTERSSAEQHEPTDHTDIDLGLDSIEWYDRFHSKIPVRNGTLAKFALGLRPYANVRENELLIDIFKAAPELVAHYFVEKSSFSFDPKLTATWIGYAAFLYSAIQLPVPSKIALGSNYGREPPPVSIILENILPRVLTQQVLTRCLNQKVGLVTFFTIRLLALVLQKLKAVIVRLRDAARESGSLWQDAGARLLAFFPNRLPKMKDIITTWRSMSSTNVVQQEVILRLIRLYYEVIPQAALEEKFDVSSGLKEALARSNEFYNQSGSSLDISESKLKGLQLSHFLQISRHTPDMRWFSKASVGSLSPCGSLLKIMAITPSSTATGELRGLLRAIVIDNGLLQLQTDPSGLDALFASLIPAEEPSSLNTVIEFLDDVLDRTYKRPVKYEDDLNHIIGNLQGKPSRTTKPISLIWATIMEQLPFVVNRDAKAAATIAIWLDRFSAAGRVVGEDEDLHEYFISQINSQLPKIGQLRENEHVSTSELRGRLSAVRVPSVSDIYAHKETSADPSPVKINANTLAPVKEDETHRGLHLWSSYPDIPTAISFNTLSPLIVCLSSSYPEVSSQALTNIRTIMTRIQPLLPSAAETFHDPLTGTTTTSKVQVKTTSFPDAMPIYLLLGIVSNTSAQGFARRGPQSPVPGIVTSYAAAAAKVLLDPLHPLYDKVNAFHTRAPKWDVSRIASYWISRVLLEAPSEDVSVSLTSSASMGSNNNNKDVHDASNGELSLAALRNKQEDAAATPYGTASHNEIHFLLCVILGSLRTPDDVEILRSRGSFEPLLALLTGGNVFVLPHGLRELVLKILWRVVLIDGGATTLITRCGLLALIAGLLVMIPKKGVQHDRTGEVLSTEAGLRALAKCAWEKCDQIRVMEWGVGVQDTVRDLIGDENCMAY